MRTASSISSARLRPSAQRDAVVARHRLGDLVADGVDRIERQHRLLEDHRDVRRRAGRQRRPRRARGCRARRRGSSRSARLRRGGSMRNSARSVTLLPEPDSPSRPSTSPCFSAKSTPLSACTVRSPVKRTCTSFISTIGASCRLCPRGCSAVARAGIDHVAGGGVAVVAGREQRRASARCTRLRRRRSGCGSGSPTAD